MSNNVDLILEKAQALTPGEKAELLDRLAVLWEDEALDPDWAAEIESRLDALDRGGMEVVNLNEVR